MKKNPENTFTDLKTRNMQTAFCHGQCQAAKPLSDFTISRGRPLRKCKGCRAEDGREKYRDDPEPQRAATRKWQQANPEKVRAYFRKWDQTESGKASRQRRQRKRRAA